MFRITDGILLGAAASLAVFLWLNGRVRHGIAAAQRSDPRLWTLHSHPVLTRPGHKDACERYRKFRLN